MPLEFNFVWTDLYPPPGMFSRTESSTKSSSSLSFSLSFSTFPVAHIQASTRLSCTLPCAPRLLFPLLLCPKCCGSVSSAEGRR